MSGAALCAALTELGFDGEDPLDADALEWPFQYEEARPLLAWICSFLRPSNVLSPSHLAQYEQLVEEGRLLEDGDLDSAFDSISAFSSKKDNQETVFGSEETILDIREAKLAYRAEVFELRKQLARQQAQFDLLAGQASTLIQGRRARVTAMSAVSGQLISLDEQLSSRNLEMNAVLGRITATTQELAHYHSGDAGAVHGVVPATGSSARRRFDGQEHRASRIRRQEVVRSPDPAITVAADGRLGGEENTRREGEGQWRCCLTLEETITAGGRLGGEGNTRREGEGQCWCCLTLRRRNGFLGGWTSGGGEEMDSWTSAERMGTNSNSIGNQESEVMLHGNQKNEVIAPRNSKME
ncbi:hypothetical protein GUJ93_ZPchr0006g41739 [Zizania palustris]|uniref:HAUS augmin-like complex subunit 3 N-terminal domain-containing protein n=1 Tax=Zizania palustris TaxID=103762 RepID=A0A8J5SNU0_ZIZPA|nr:hypothetical protein GUJ93_ZPchr0006g41739 [Zizania palustris]